MVRVPLPTRRRKTPSPSTSHRRPNVDNDRRKTGAVRMSQESLAAGDLLLARDSAERAAREAGRILRRMQAGISAREKGPADLVTEADLAAQAAIEQILTTEYPSFGFLGEESPPTDALSAGRPEAPLWIVDPLDGTTNYVHGLDNYCVSIALRDRGELVLGLIFDPVRDQVFSAIRGGGAFRDGRPLRTSGTRDLTQALVAASFAAKVPPESPEVARFVQVLHRARAVRRLGSAALNLAYVAAGNLDGYWATSVKIWDIAAGWVLVREAGGVLSGLDGMAPDPARPQFAAAATPELQAELLRTLATSS
jgi:myo-inositol-1(or 4)-monophosphatase